MLLNPESQSNLKNLSKQISKHTGKRNTDKKQPLFNWYPGEHKTECIVCVKPPNTICCKPYIPGNKGNSNQNSRFYEGYKMMIKQNSFVKRSYKANGYRKKQYQHVGEWLHFSLVFKYILKYLIGTYRNPKHSPSSFPKCLWCCLCALLSAKKYGCWVVLNTFIRWWIKISCTKK